MARHDIRFCSNCGAGTTLRTPDGDHKERAVCDACSTVHYRNPLIVVGCVPETDDGRILLCRRSIEPRYGFWTVPAGFMELGETIEQGAARETAEEACATVEIGRLFASVDVLHAGQLHLFFRARLLSDHRPGEESLETELFSPDDLPWDELAFKSGVFALRRYVEDAGRDQGLHRHVIE